MDDVFEIVRRHERSLAVIAFPETRILAVNDACVELFGESADALVGRSAGSLFHGADEVHTIIALSALAVGAMDSFCARRRLQTRADAEAWVCVRAFDVDDRRIALATAAPVDQPRPLDAVEEALATATDRQWLSPVSVDGPSSSRHQNVMGAYSVLDGLPPRQREIVAALLQGHRASTIAASQFVSASTVRSHLSALYKAFGVHSQTELLSLLRTPNSSSAGAGTPKK
jgi:DNA-binding NarL/FixJ family response regulator